MALLNEVLEYLRGVSGPTQTGEVCAWRIGTDSGWTKTGWSV